MCPALGMCPVMFRSQLSCKPLTVIEAPGRQCDSGSGAIAVQAAIIVLNRLTRALNHQQQTDNRNGWISRIPKHSTNNVPHCAVGRRDVTLICHSSKVRR